MADPRLHGSGCSCAGGARTGTLEREKEMSLKQFIDVAAHVSVTGIVVAVRLGRSSLSPPVPTPLLRARACGCTPLALISQSTPLNRKEDSRMNIPTPPLGKSLGLAATITAAAGLFVAAGQASASIIEYNFTGSLQSYIVPVTGQYDLMAYGAGGGNGNFGANRGGRGAEIGGRFTLTAGTVLTVLVGEQGTSAELSFGYSGGGGGGASAVYITGAASPLVMAGGGGGAGPGNTASSAGGWGRATRNGDAGENAGTSGGLGGVNGFGGGAGGAASEETAGGGGGAGWLGGGGSSGAGVYGDGFGGLSGPSWAGGGGIFYRGGFGGGGAASDASGGGGGGYSGGGGGGLGAGGGGGGSFVWSESPNFVLALSAGSGTLPGNGLVTITLIPTPGATGLLAIGGLAAMRRRRI